MEKHLSRFCRKINKARIATSSGDAPRPLNPSPQRYVSATTEPINDSVCSYDNDKSSNDVDEIVVTSVHRSPGHPEYVQDEQLAPSVRREGK